MDTKNGISGLVDSHAHLDMEPFDPDRREVVQRAFRSGLSAILCPADLSQPRSLPIILELVREFPGIIAAAGVHPHQAAGFSPDHELRLQNIGRAGTIRAVGEIGLDYHYELSSREAQNEVLRRQLVCAREIGLPAILHSRHSGRDILSAVDEAKFENGGILHCFTEDWPTAREMIERGFSISFSGILTFPKAEDMRSVARKIPLDRLLVETDSPYLAPVPYRGRIRRNEPAFVVETAKHLAELKGMSLGELTEQTTRNFFTLFPFEKKNSQC